MTHTHTDSADLRERLRAAIAHLDHVLPGQASIKDFVHHNTIHGYQQQKFPDALRQVYELTGNYGYLPAAQYRAYYAQGRISAADLDAALDADTELQADAAVTAQLKRRAVYHAALLHDIKPLSGCRLQWQIQEAQALSRCQDTVSRAARQALLAGSEQANEAAAIADLWQACLQQLDLEHVLLHPETLQDLAPQLGEEWERQRAQNGADDTEAVEEPPAVRQLRRAALAQQSALFAEIGVSLTLRGLLKQLTSRDILVDLRPVLLRHLAAYLDQGVAAWHHPRREQGLYRAWKTSAAADLGHVFDALPDYETELRALPEDPFDTVLAELRRLRLPEARWEGYLQQLALELPGWSGMVNWLAQRPGYAGLPAVDMLDYLAVRLVLERLYAQRACRNRWGVAADLDALDTFFRVHYAELFVRLALYTSRLPEYLADKAQRLANRSSLNPAAREEWRHAADLIQAWRATPAADQAPGYSVHGDAWRLFSLAQHLGLSGAALREFSPAQIEELFACLERLDEQRSGFIWLQAYERHYRDRLLQALAANHGRGRRFVERPQAQLMFCMDDREEGIRRHIEERYPDVETLGAAGFFNLPINWRGLDDEAVTPLCPVVQTPSNEIKEQPQAGAENLARSHQNRRARRLRVKNWLHQEVRRNLFSSALLIAAAAPLALPVLLGKIFLPRHTAAWLSKLRQRFDRSVPSRIEFTAPAASPAATPENPRLGFTDAEQAARVENFLRMVGLTQNFAPLVVMFGHGSGSQNNPHLAAYDCGACSGRHSGPNARTFAAIANRPEIRRRLSDKGIVIPDDTWFLGVEHNTCDEVILWYDEDRVPPAMQDKVADLREILAYGCRASAQERCRRFASAPAQPGPQQALNHVIGRAHDFSQARPELGHATNAAAFIGRRSMSRGAFFDRRVFLISYDPTQDPDGSIVENILLAAGPVGAGINLEYYFSTVNNERFGCGTKVLHNVTGFFGVMEGTGSDLRTGLPRQMIEIHEAMRLQVVVEADIDILSAIYQRQPPLQELVGNGWLLLSAKHPDSGAIHTFDPAQGWLPWQPQDAPPPSAARSQDWYRGHSGPLWPALITTPEEAAR